MVIKISQSLITSEYSKSYISKYHLINGICIDMILNKLSVDLLAPAMQLLPVEF